jgi:hypothetical protein
MTEHGYRPTPATTDTHGNRQHRSGHEPPMSASWYARSMARAARDLRRALEYGQPVDLGTVALTVSDTMRAVEKVSQHMEVAALTAHPSVGLQVIRAGGLAEHAALAFAEVHLLVLLATHADRRRSEGKDAS